MKWCKEHDCYSEVANNLFDRYFQGLQPYVAKVTPKQLLPHEQLTHGFLEGTIDRQYF